MSYNLRDGQKVMMRQREGRRNTVAEGSCKKPRGGRDSRASGTKRNDSLVERRNVVKLA